MLNLNYLKDIKYIGIIGDIHTQDKLLNRTISFFNKKGINNILSTGDIVDGPGNVNECIRILKKNNIKTVLGNHDRWILNNQMRLLPDANKISDLEVNSIKYLKALPKTIQILSPIGNVLLCHGINENDMNKINPNDFGYALEVNEDLQNIINDKYYRIIINGHSHKRMFKIINSLYIINAGTLYYEHDPCFVILDIIERIIYFYVFDEYKNIQMEDKYLLP